MLSLFLSKTGPATKLPGTRNPYKAIGPSSLMGICQELTAGLYLLQDVDHIRSQALAGSQNGPRLVQLCQEVHVLHMRNALSHRPCRASAASTCMGMLLDAAATLACEPHQLFRQVAHPVGRLQCAHSCV